MIAHYGFRVLALLMALCLALLSAVPASGNQAQQVLKLCTGIAPHPPYSDPRKETPMQARIRQAAGNVGFVVEYIPLPGLRCLHDVRQGRLDGAVGVGDRVALRQGMRLPLRDGQMDGPRTLSYMPFVFIRRKGDRVEWDGQRYHHLQGPVLVVQQAHEIKQEVKRSGAHSVDVARGPNELAAMLLAKRANLGADSLARVDEIMALPEFAGHFEKLEKPLGGRWGVLAISPQFYQQQPQRIEALWDEYARLRKRDEAASPP